MPPQVAEALEPRTFTRQEISGLNSQLTDDDREAAMKFTIIDNKVYDVTDFVHEHPGGEQVLLTHVGKDASDVFHAMHPASAYEVLANNYVGDLAKDVSVPKATNSVFAAEMREYRDKLQEQGYFNADKGFYLYKLVSTVGLSVVSLAVLRYFGQSTIGVLVSAVIMGMFWQQCGWLSHDFGHHQVFEDRSLNDMVVVFLGNLCQGFSLSWWKNKHNTHHASTNVHGQDPDINTAPILLWDEYTSSDYYSTLSAEDSGLAKFIAQNIIPNQTRYFFFILAFARLSWAHSSMLYSFKKGALNKSATLNFFERAAIVLHWTVFAAVTYFWIDTPLNRVLFFLVSQSTTGYALALVFALNHSGMPVISEEKAEEMEFFEIQVITGRDVKNGLLGDWFCGGLNYQIEHHLFPNMPRHNLKKVQPKVIEICRKHNVPYHLTSFWRGTLEVLQTLDIVQKVSAKLSKKAF
uniref:Delta-6 fatty acid desaturase 2 n=1 Tax=Mortierella isabellina TaxID=91625 RepID=A0A0K2FPQ3_MORIS|nr:delta-6 fatty acid desaturase 2 [Umbelopsis isabellina]